MIRIPFARRQSKRKDASKGTARQTLLQRLERRVLLNAVPDVTVDVADEALIGETVDFTITFDLDDAAPGPGFGPFIDVILPRNGADGAAGTDTPDGIGTEQPVSFDFFGTSLSPVLDVVVDATGTVEHPLLKNPDGTPTVVTGLTPGDRFIVLQLPLGSYEPTTIPLEINGTANLSNLADVGVALPIEVRGGFQFGCDPLDNPSVDNPNDTVSGFDSDSVTPEVILINKVVNADEQETATGRNFPKSYTINVDIADGQTVTGVDISDPISDRIVYLNNVQLGGSSSDANSGVIRPPEPTIDMGPQTGETLIVDYASAVGTSAEVDLSVTFDFYVPETDSAGNPIIDPMSGAPSMTQNSAKATYDWIPIDTRDSPVIDEMVEDPLDGQDQKLTNRSIAVQKDVSVVIDNNPGVANPAPGDVLEYRIEFQVSDYFDFNDVIVNDLLSNGQIFDSTFTPEMGIVGNGGNPSAQQDFTPTNFTVDLQAAGPFGTDIQFRVTDELGSRGLPTSVIGNDMAAPGTMGVIVYRAVVDSAFRDGDMDPGNDVPVVEGDRLSNQVEIEGTVLKPDGSEGGTPTDGSNSGITIPRGGVDKDVYAVNGDLIGDPLASPPLGSPGDLITYRIQYDLPQTRFSDLVLTDTLPLPIFDASTVTTGTFDSFLSGSNVPGVGEITYGPDSQDFFNLYYGGAGLEPTLSPGQGNSFVLDFGDFAAAPPTPTTIDLLFTVEFADFPFSDGLFLSNLIVSSQGSTNNGNLVDGDLAQIISNTPKLNLNKGVVSTDTAEPPAEFEPTPVGPVNFADPGSTSDAFTPTVTTDGLAINPIDSDLKNVDAGDLVKFAIVIENTGNGEGFDVIVNDSFPDGFVIPTGTAGLNLQVASGDGTRLDFTDADGNVITSGNEENFFFTNPPAGGTGEGIRVVDPEDLDPTGSKGDGAIDGLKGSETNGKNIIVVTFDLEVADSAEAGAEYPDTGTLARYGGKNNGNNWTVGVDGDFTDDALVTITQPEVQKTLVTTEIISATNAIDEAVIGELVTYDITVRIPEGITADAILNDTFDLIGPMAFVEFVSIDANTALSTSLGGFDQVTPNVGTDGLTVDFDLGTITNTDRDNALDELITIRVVGVVLNDVTNQRGVDIVNAAKLSYTAEGKQISTDFATSEVVEVIEPTVDVIKTATINGATAPPSTGDAGDPVTYTIALEHASDSDTDAFELRLTDPLPAEIVNTSISSVTDSAGILTTGDFVIVGGDGGTLQIALAGDTNQDQIDFEIGRVVTVTISGELDISIAPGQPIVNEACIDWTSLDGEPGQRSVYNTSSTERTGDDGPNGALNDYAACDEIIINAVQTGLVKSIDSTSEAHTGNVNGVEEFAIGEIVRYRLTTRIPESTINDATIQDLLPNGLLYLEDGTTKVAFIGDDPTLFTSSAFDPTVYQNEVFIVGDQNTVDSIDPIHVLDASLITADSGSGNFGSGVDPIFSLKDIVNNENDANEEFVIIEFNAIAMNVGGNQAGRQRDNRYQVEFDRLPPDVTIISNRVDGKIVEPNLTVEKSLLNSPEDGNDQVGYVINVSNSGGGNATSAFDVNLVDLLEPSLDLINFDVTPGFGVTDNSDIPNNLIDLTIDEIEKGEVFTIFIQAVVDPLVDSGLMINNVADVTYTSLPGEFGTQNNPTGSSLPGLPNSSPGQSSGERTGAGNPNPNDLNNYFDSDNAKFTVTTPTVLKVVDPTEYTIGELIDYEILVTLSEGTTNSLVVTDDLPDGLEYVSHRIIKNPLLPGGNLLTKPFNGNLPTPTSNNPSGSGTDLVLTFGDSVTAADNDVDNNAFVVIVQARVLNELGNQNGDTLTNTGQVQYLDPNTLTDTVIDTNSVDVDLVEPELTVDKQISSPSPGTLIDAGDVIQYTVVIEHSPGSTSDAFEVMFRDLAPNNTQITGVVSVNATGVTAPTAEIATDGSSIVLSDAPGSGEFDLPEGATVTVVYEITVLDTVAPGEMIMNTAMIDWSSLDGDINSGAPDGERDGSGRPDLTDVNDYFTEDSTKITAAIPEIEKSVFSSSVPGTIDPDLAIGEQVTFRLTVTLPEATYPNDFVVSDVLPTTPGVLEYVSAQFLSGESDSDIQFSSLDTTQSGELITFTFTDLVNPSTTGTNDNLLVFEVVAVVPDVQENTNGDVLTNTGNVTYPGFTDTDTEQVNIVEPVVMLEKSSPTTVASVGDTVTYTLEVTNASSDGATAPAYDLVITDDLLNSMGIDDTLDLVVGSVTAVSTGAGTVVITEGNTLGDDEVEVTVNQLEVDQTITVTFQATLNANVDPAGDMVINTSNVDWDSLPGPGGRDGTDHDDHKINTPQQELDITKIVQSTSEPTTGTAQYDPTITDLAIGEIVTYAITVDLPSGLYNDDVIITDQLPDFLALINGVIDVRVLPGAGISLNDADIVTDDLVGMDGYDDFLTVTLDVDQVQLPGSPSDSQVVIEVDAQVLNVLGNQATGNPLTNTAEVVFASFTDSDSVDVELVEPELEVEKTITNQPSSPDAGDIITYQVVIDHSGNSTADALNVRFVDQAPADTLFQSVNIIDDGGVPGLTAQIAAGGTEIRLGTTSTLDEFDLQLGSSITIEYTLQLQDSVELGQMLINDAFAEWTSLSGDQNPGSETGERDGSGARDPDSLNNYFDFDQEKLTVGGFLELDKSVIGPTEYAIGDTVIYELEVGLSEGTTPDVVVLDDIPDVMTIDTNTVMIISGSNISFNPAAPQISFDGDILTVDVGSVTNAGDNDPNNDSFIIRYEALVKNDPANSNGQTKKNIAEVSSSNNLTDMDMEQVKIVEPFLDIDKSISDETPHLGDTVTYTFEITHNGQSTTDAYDLIISDTLPPEVTVDANTIKIIAPPGAVVTDNSSGNVIDIRVSELELGESVTVTFDAAVTSDIQDYGKMFTNTVTLDWDSQPGTNPEERPDMTQDNAKATIIGPDLEIDKSTDATTLFPGDIFTYELVVTNKTGPFEDIATGVTVVDVLPPGVTFVSSASPFFDSQNPNLGTVTWVIPQMNPGESVTLDLTVQLSDPAPSVEIICNKAIVTHDDIDPTPPDNIDEEKTPIDESVVPDLTITKDDGVVQVFPGDVLTYDIIVTNVGNQDALGIVVTDLFPKDILDFISASDGGVYDSGTGVVTWNFPSLGGNGDQITLTLTGKVKLTVLDPTISEFTNIVSVKDNGELGPDPTPENNIDTDTDRVIFYGTDAFNDFLDHPDRHLPRYKPVARSGDTILTGTADPGTTLYLEITDQSGQVLGWRSVVADVSGNYVALFQDVSIDEGPHRSFARQTFAAQNSSDSAGYNLRRYFEPAAQASTYFTESASVEGVFRNRAGQVLHSMQSSDQNPLRLTDLENLSSYESSAGSPLPAGG